MVSGPKPRLLFVSPIFLFPADAGGKIRTGNILRGLKGGHFDVTLMSPAAPGQAERHQDDIAQVCDDFIAWRSITKPRWLRAFDLLRELPVNVAADNTRPARDEVARAVAGGDYDIVVYDFVHAAVLRPHGPPRADVCFTHNVEAEIFARHAEHASNPLLRHVWAAQHGKMLRYEPAALERFSTVIAVSERDADLFRSGYRLPRVDVIPTGVDLDFFHWQAPPPVDDAHAPTVVFVGSMNSAANIGGVRFFIESIWPGVLERAPRARFLVVGRDPPASLRALSQVARNVEFTGAVDDVRPFVRTSHVSVIPLQVGGGTRIKAFEAMALGCPVVSTTVGIEGLDVDPDHHYLREDEPAGFAAAVAGLLADDTRRQSLSNAARALVEDRFGHTVAARAFESICVSTLARTTGRSAAPAA